MIKSEGILLTKADILRSSSPVHSLGENGMMSNNNTSAWEAIKSITLDCNHWHDIGMILAMMACLQAKFCAMSKMCACLVA